MAKCKVCRTQIEDDAEYCFDCLNNDIVKKDEAYLDSLLDTVKNFAPTAEDIYKKQKTVDLEDSEINSHILLDTNEEIDYLDFDTDKIENLNQSNLGEDFSEDMSKDYNDNNLFDNISLDIFEDAELNELIEDKQDEDMNNDESKIQKQSEDFVGNTEEFVGLREEDLLNLMTDGLSFDDLQPEATNELDQDLDGIYSDLVNHDLNGNNEVEISQSTGEERDSKNQEEEEDFIELLNQIAVDDPVADDVKAISDMMSGLDVSPLSEDNVPSDVGEVFSDALSAVSHLNDPLMEENIDEEGSRKKRKRKFKNSKKSKENQADPLVEGELDPKPKKSLMKRLFANVEDKSKKKPITLESDTETAATEETAKKAKRWKKKAASKGENQENDNDKIAKKLAKKEKREKKKKVKEVVEVLEEIEEDEGRINRVGAFIVFAFFGVLALFLIIGSNALTYRISIRHAKNYFEEQEYTQAYNEVYGMDIKPEDIVIYDKIRTVMYVNKQLNSYHNYYTIGDYPEALDSLLKGLRRYDKYIELAKLLDIETDMDYVREQLVMELETVFHLSEKEALKLNTMKNMEEYSLTVYELAKKQ